MNKPVMPLLVAVDYGGPGTYALGRAEGAN